MSLLNRTNCRRLALEQGQLRAHKFTRCSAGFLDDLDARLRNMIEQSVRSHPSVGRTLMGPKPSTQKEE